MILEYCHECRTVRLTNEYDIQKYDLPYPPCAVCKGEVFFRVDEVWPVYMPPRKDCNVPAP